MPALDTEAQFKFLLCCIKHSTAGKVNFNEVASELGIVSKAAAAKRYERLLKSHDITVATPRKGAASGKDKGDDDNDSESKDVKTPATKKRKRGAASEIIKDDDDEEETPVKKERAGMKREKGVKKEETIEVKVKKEAAAANVVNYVDE